MTDPAAAPVPPSAPTPPAYAAPPSRPGRVLGIVGLILAIVSPFQLVGLILSIVALAQSKKAGLKNGPAVAGIIVSIVLLVLTVLVFVLLWFLVWSPLLEFCATNGPGVYNDGTITCG